MEEQLLQDMINDRDKKISQVKAEIEARKDDLNKAREELTRLRAVASDNRLKYRRQIADITKSRLELRQDLEQLEREVQNQNGSLHAYADILREAAPDSVDSSYVLRMQSQLCKAMHSMGILEHQMSLVKENSSALVKDMKESMNVVVEEKSKIELDFMNKMMAIDNARREAEEDFQGKMNQQARDQETSSMNGAAAHEQADEEEEEEGKLTEEQMEEYLAELDEAIEEMREKTEAQRAKIKLLESQVQEQKNLSVSVETEERKLDEPPHQAQQQEGGVLEGDARAETEKVESETFDDADGPPEDEEKEDANDDGENEESEQQEHDKKVGDGAENEQQEEAAADETEEVPVEHPDDQ